MTFDRTGRETDPFNIVGRLERLPLSRWHMRMRLIVGTAWFFDAFDALAIAYVLPALIPQWHLGPAEIGLLISIGYVGQALGSIAFGWLAQRWGRISVASLTVLLFSGLSLACAFAPSYTVLFWLRLVQGFGLGGEVPVMHAYVNEFARSRSRARFALVYQLPFPIGIAGVALVSLWVVPTLGWQWMFIIGVLPAIVSIPLRFMLPESPRWLASQGRFEAADKVLTDIENKVSEGGRHPLPPVTEHARYIEVRAARIGDLFKPPYLGRTIVMWLIWFTTYLVVYGLSVWLPSLYRTVYKLPVDQALKYGFISTLASLVGAFMVAYGIDRTGRKPWIGIASIIAGIPLVLLWNAASQTPEAVLAFVFISVIASNSVALALGVYNAEIYPTHLRALAIGVCSAWLRVASVIGPLFIGFLLPLAGIGAVFVCFGLVSIIGGLIFLYGAKETRGMVLEDISPKHESVTHARMGGDA